MGMAASQARYLTLSARKTNTEYEGQQLNQQRLNIANQSADLFNQMLTMSVPTCPDSNDFTTLQYSWSDGINDEVISDFYQISVPNEDYNYVVTSYRYENVYTGQAKRMNSPEIQAAKTNNFSDNRDKEYQVLQSAYHKESLPGAGDDSYTLVVQRGSDNNKVETTRVFKRVDSTLDSIEELDAITKRTTQAVAGDKAQYVKADKQGTNGQNVIVTPAKWGFDTGYTVTVRVPTSLVDKTADPTAQGYDPNMDMSEDPNNPNMPFTYVDGSINAAFYKDINTGAITWLNEAWTDVSDSGFNQIDFDNEEDRDKIEQLMSTYGDKYDMNKTYFATKLQGTTDDDFVAGTGALDGKQLQKAKYRTALENGTAADGTTTINLTACTDESNPPQALYAYGGKYYDGTDLSTANEVTPVGKVTLTLGDEKDVFVDNATGKIYTAPDGTGAVYNANDGIVKLQTSGGIIVDASGTPVYAFVCGEDMDDSAGSQGAISKVEIRGGDKTAYYTDGEYVLSGEELSAIDLTSASQAEWLDTLFFHSVDNDPQFHNFTSVGNCDLNSISQDTYNSNEDMRIEIQQVIDDMKKGGNNVAYGNLSACFDSTTGEYLGGIYSFKMFGHTYYTTTADLESAVKGAYEENATATNGIDSQNKLTYYTSTYINTKIEDSKKALLETDGKGRFSTVKFEDDSTVYTLKCETITDEAAYQNAMNAYFYKQEQYDKAVADINARTEIIQAEDRELQLRLEQLGTEQTALQTEMEACQKVVQKSIESTFKTFGG